MLRPTGVTVRRSGLSGSLPVRFGERESGAAR